MIGSSRVLGTSSISARYLRVLPSRTQHQPITVPIGGAQRYSGLAEIATTEGIGDQGLPNVELFVIAGNTDGTTALSALPSNLYPDLILTHQIVATAERGLDPRVSTVTQEWQEVAVCDLAKESSRQSVVMLDARTALAVTNEG